MDQQGQAALVAIVAGAFEANGVADYNRDHARVGARVAGEKAVYDIVVTASEEARIVMCGVHFPNAVPEGRRRQTAEAMMRANATIRFGAFLLDFADGEASFRTAVDLRPGPLRPDAVNSLVFTGLLWCDHFHDALMAVALGDAEPGEAMAELTDE